MSRAPQQFPQTTGAVQLVFCTAPEPVVRSAIKTLPDNTPVCFIGPESSPFNHPDNHFISWGTGPFSIKKFNSLYRRLKVLKVAGILLTLNHTEGNGYGLLRLLCKALASRTACEAGPDETIRPITWSVIAGGSYLERAVFAGLFKACDLMFPLFHNWLKPHIPEENHRKRPPLETVTAQDHYEPEPPEVSIIIRTLNEEKFLTQTLEMISRQKGPTREVIVIDSGSSDRTLEIAKSFSVRVYTIKKETFHYSAVLNLGAQLARGKYLVNLSAHAVPQSLFWLNNLIQPLIEDNTVCGTFGRELAMPGWASPFEQKLLSDMFPDRRIERRSCFFFSNANSAMPRQLVLGTPFDETVNWGEDQVWVHALQQQGFKTVYVPDSPVNHSHNLSMTACFVRTLKFQRMLIRKMHRDQPELSRNTLRAQLPDRAIAFRQFMNRQGLNLWGTRWLVALLCEHVNFMGCEIALREYKALPTSQPVKEISGTGNGVKVSVVIPNWNGAHLLKPCLYSLTRMNFSDYEIIVVDDGSTDGSLKLLREEHPNVRRVELAQNHGFARAVNEGIKVAGGKYIALLNNDIEVEPDWLAQLVDAVERYPECAIAASAMMYHDARDVFYNAGDQFHPWGAGGARGEGERNHRQYDDDTDIFGACAGAALYRREVFDTIGLFDETFESLAEDVDLNARARLAGFQTVYVPGAVVYHHGSATLGRYSERYVRLVSRNEWFVMIKNLPLPLFLKYMWRILKHHMSTSAYFSFRGQGLLLLKARWSVLLNLGRLLRARCSIQKNGVISGQELARWFPPDAVKFDAKTPVKTEKPVPGLISNG